jgi:hypothetical protein
MPSTLRLGVQLCDWGVLAVIGFFPGLSACDSTQPIACTEDIVALTVTVVNGVGQPLAGLSVTDTVHRTGAVLDLTAAAQPVDLPADGGPAIVFSDEFRSAVLPSGDQVAVVVSAGGQVANGTYRFGVNGCHVQKLAGPDSLLLD